MTTPLPLQPFDDDGPVFTEPWQAQAFALAVTLSDQGVFTWEEWTQTMGATIKAAQAAGDPDLGNTYYDHWLKALETLAQEKGAVTPEQLHSRKDQWQRAYENTPHGQPVHLSAAKP